MSKTTSLPLCYIIIEVIKMTMQKAIQSRLSQLCQERGLSLSELCTLCKIDPSTIGSINDGTCEGTSYEALVPICLALGIELSEFFRHEIFRSLELS